VSEMYAEKLLRDLWKLKVKKSEATGAEFERLSEMESKKWLEVCSYLSARASGQEDVGQ
jgi:hypothetical protein